MDETKVGDYCHVRLSFRRLGEVADGRFFQAEQEERSIPSMSILLPKLYSTYLSYLPEDQFSYDLKMNMGRLEVPSRVYLTLIETSLRKHTKPGITKGNHWHHN